ncbi:MAG: hypothetical protein K2R93_12385 [Gemmatimonadaceae bacterium]|nr:hypothetical protein [Gemmatimonadaceae bacterium]
MKINGQTDTNLGLKLVSLSGWMEGPMMNRSLTALPQVLGSVPAGFATASPRQIECTFRIDAAGLSEREAKMATVQDALAGLLLLSFDDHPTRLIRAVATSIVATGITERAILIVPSFTVTIRFVAWDPASYDEEPSVISFGSAPKPIPMGTLPSPGVVFITGALSAGSSRTLTYRSFNGIAYGSLTLTPPSSPAESLGANDWLEVNLLRRTIIKCTSGGTRASVYHWKTAGAWFTLEPADSFRTSSIYPTLAIDSGAASYVYRRAWAL